MLLTCPTEQRPPSLSAPQPALCLSLHRVSVGLSTVRKPRWCVRGSLSFFYIKCSSNFLLYVFWSPLLCHYVCTRRFSLRLRTQCNPPLPSVWPWTRMNAPCLWLLCLSSESQSPGCEGQLVDSEERFGDFDKKCIGLLSLTTPFRVYSCNLILKNWKVCNVTLFLFSQIIYCRGLLGD